MKKSKNVNNIFGFQFELFTRYADESCVFPSNGDIKYFVIACETFLDSRSLCLFMI